MEVTIEKDFGERVSGYRAVIIRCDVENSPTQETCRAEMDALADEIQSRYKIEEINKIPAIAATRNAYRVCGKDPNRYRPSQEQLMRRIVRGLGLYTVNSIVDTGNMLSLLTGCSVGCFDADKIDGESISLGIGRHDEPYEGIGRGPLNIEGLPVFRDATGGIGTPTSDNERTKIELTTRRLLMTIHLFCTETDLEQTMATACDLFTRHCRAANFTVKTIQNP